MFRRRLLPFLALAFASLGMTAASAAVWPPVNYSGIESACRTHGGLQAMAAEANGSAALGIDGLCACFIGRLDDIEQSGIDLLTKDLLGTSTPAERTTFGAYIELSDRALRELEICRGSPDAPATTATLPPPAEAAAPPEPPVQTSEVEVAAPMPEAAPVTPPLVAPIPATPKRRLSREAVDFLNTCVTSRPFRGYLDGMNAGDADRQGTVCSCLTAALVPSVTGADLTILARDFSPERDPATPPAENFSAIATLAKDGLRACMRDVGLTPDF